MKHTHRLFSLLLAVILCMSCITPALAADGPFTLAGANMTLGNELSINFFIKKTDLKVTEGCTAQILHNGVVTQAPIEPFSNTYHKVSHSVAAKQMADEITVRILDADGNALSAPYTDSVRSYAMRALSSDTATDLVKTMVVDMLNYGAAAQAHFGYDTADPANRLLTEAQQALATVPIASINGQIKGKNCYGSNLSLEDRILFNMYFSGMKGKDISSMYATIAFTGYDGKKHDIRVEGSEFYRMTANIYGVIVDDIVLADSDCPVTVTVYDADGSVYGSATDSVESYNARAASSDTHGLYASIMCFFRSAHAYLTDSHGIPTHHWNTGELTKAATDTEVGTIVYTCLDDGCGETKEKTVAAGVRLLTRADLEEAIEEVSWDYLLKKDKIQYDSMELDAMGKYYSGKYLVTEGAAPEHGTSHTEINSVCSDYVWKVYEEALHHNLLGVKSSLEAVTADMWYNAENQVYTSDEEDIDSTVVRWQSLAFTDLEVKYGVPGSPHFVQTKEEVFDYFLNWQTKLRVGDVLVDKGHALIYAGNGKVLHCNGTKYQPTNGTLNHEESGSVYGVSPLSCEDTSWLKTRANTGRLIVFRPNEFLVTKDTDGDLSNDLVRDYSFTMPEDTLSRLAYPGMEIDRTVDITPFGTACVGQELTYSVKISNMTTNTKYLTAMQVADPAYAGVNYEALTVTEAVPAGTEFVSATEGGLYDETTNTITWTLDIAAGKVVTPAYTVKVTGEIGDTIVCGGGFVADIPSNTISNRIGGEKLNEFAVDTLADIAASNTANWTYGTDLAFAEAIYEEAETGLALPTVSEIVEDLFYWTSTLGEIRNTRYSAGKPDVDVFMLREDADMSMVIDTYYGGYRFFTGPDAIGSTISEFRLDYLEPGDIIVNCDTEAGKVTGAQVAVYAGNEKLLISNADGSYQVLSGSTAKLQLWKSFLASNDLFFALRPSQVTDLKAAHTWDEGEITKTPTCAEEGEMTFTCLDDGCGKTKTKVLDKTTDHIWNDSAVDNGNGTHTITCSLCGTSKSETHDWDDGVGDSAQKLFTCTVCAATKTEVGSLSAEQIALLQSFAYTKGNMSAAANVRQAPPHYADTIYAAICMDGLAEKFTSYTAAGALSQAFRLMEGSDYGNFDRTYVLRTEANGYISENGTAYQVASMVVDGFYGGPWLTDEGGSRLTNKGADMDIHDLQPGDVILLGENTAKFEAMMWVLVYQGEMNGQHTFLFGSSYYGGTYTNVEASSIAYRGHLKFDAETGSLEEVIFQTPSNNALVELAMENQDATFNEFLMNDPVSGVQWEYFYAIRPCKVMGTGTHTWSGNVCSVCGMTRSADEHTCEGTYTDNEDGTHTFTCTVCEEETVSEHTYDDGITNGETIVYTCTLCDATKTETVEQEELALSDAQLEALQKLTYHKGSMTAASNSRQRPVHFADTIYAAIGLDGLVEKFNGGLTAASVLAQPFQRLDSNGSVYTQEGRSYVLRTAGNGYLTVDGVTHETALMVVDGFYGGSWILDANGDRMTDAADTMDIADLQPGDVLIMGENTGSYDALLWVMVYQGVLDGQHVFMFGNTYYGSNYPNVSATVSYRGKLCFNAKTGILEKAVFNNSISSTGTEVTLTTEGAVGTFTFNDWLREDLVSGVNWEYFYALRPGTVMNAK